MKPENLKKLQLNIATVLVWPAIVLVYVPVRTLWYLAHGGYPSTDSAQRAVDVRVITVCMVCFAFVTLGWIAYWLGRACRKDES